VFPCDVDFLVSAIFSYIFKNQLSCSFVSSLVSCCCSF
jgi:hypothetical protein